MAEWELRINGPAFNLARKGDEQHCMVLLQMNEYDRDEFERMAQQIVDGLNFTLRPAQ